MSAVAAFTGTPANMAAIEAAFQANWAGANFMKSARRPNAVVTTDLSAGQSIRLFIRSAMHGGTPIWAAHEDGPFVIPAKLTTAGDEWTTVSYTVLQEWSGLVVHATAAATVRLSTSGNP